MVDEPKQPVWKITRTARVNARRLRRDMTDAERAIWNELRAHRLNGASFRRQKPVGPYIVDFICEHARLIIELDGGQHYESQGIERDRRRDSYLASEGYKVLRFNNHDVLANKAGVLDIISATIQTEAPSLTFPASGEEGGDAK